MKLLSRVVWSEGMYLAPHHFQTQSRYFEDSIAFVASSLWRQPWGMLHLEMDPEALLNGTASLLHASGIFADGLGFEMPGSDTLPPSRAVNSLLAPSSSSLVLHLAIRMRQGDGHDIHQGDGSEEIVESSPQTRNTIAYRTLRDETNGLDEQKVGLVGKCIRILSSDELTDDVLSIPIARITRDAANRFVYDPEFVPCSLRLSASDALMLQIGRLLEVVTEKSKTIGRPIRNRPLLRDLPMDIANYWFLHALHSAIPVLQHIVRARHAHPSDCFRELSKLAGALCTFTLESSPGELPTYDHDNPGPAFRSVCSQIYQHLEVVVPTNVITPSFHSSVPYLYSATIDDERALRRSRWILGVRSSLGESEQLRLVPRLVKICSSRFVQELVKRALPGLSLTHLPIPPAALHAEPDMQYYGVDTAGPCWQHILHTRTVGIYIPGEISDPDFTLSIIVEQIA